MTTSNSVYGFRLEQFGGPEVLQFKPFDLPPPGPDEARILHHAIGVNFFDIYTRMGLEKLPLPHGVGAEAAGVVEAVGADVTGVNVGDRVAYAPVIGDAYAEARNIPAWRLVRLPDEVSFELAAASFLKGMTAQYLLNQIVDLEPGNTILFHAAAGGVGLIAGQWARALGLRAIGTAGGPEKCKLALTHGYEEVIDYKSENFVACVKDLTAGRGVRAVFDSIGKDTLDGSLDCLAPKGILVCFGAASGPRPPLSIESLSHRGSLFVTRPTLRTYAGTPEGLARGSGDLLRRLVSGVIRVKIGATFPLKDAAKAHEALEARATTGSTILVP
jgi:NADPH:quinone reductase